jgi:hypothetical protein
MNLSKHTEVGVVFKENLLAAKRKINQRPMRC